MSRMVVEARKLYADGEGAETEAPLDEEFEFGVFTAEPGAGRVLVGTTSSCSNAGRSAAGGRR